VGSKAILDVVVCKKQKKFCLLFILQVFLASLTVCVCVIVNHSSDVRTGMDTQRPYIHMNWFSYVQNAEVTK
jgi:hypothetical protein